MIVHSGPESRTGRADGSDSTSTWNDCSNPKHCRFQAYRRTTIESSGFALGQVRRGNTTVPLDFALLPQRQLQSLCPAAGEC